MQATRRNRTMGRRSSGLLVPLVALALAVTALLGAPNPGRAVGLPAAGAPSTGRAAPLPDRGVAGTAPRTGPNTAPGGQNAAGRGYALTLGEPGDFVTQYTDVACVGASIQTMLNLIRPGADRRPATQAGLLKIAQQLSTRAFIRRIGGASAMGWAYALERSGGGPYRVRAFATRGAALRAVVDAMRATDRPAGLLVWRGVHAWVVSGFRTTADPAGSTYAVTGLVIDDPWWPRATSSHGPPHRPGSELAPAQLGGDFVPYQRGRPGSGSELNGNFVVVLPVDPASILERAKGML